MLNKYAMPCAICRTKNEVRNDVSRMRNISERIKRSVRDATDEDIEKKNEYLMRNRYVYSIFEYHKKCSYGIHCSSISSDVSNFNSQNREVAEDLVLLAIMDIQEAKTYIREFGGHYPKAARFLEMFNVD